MKKSILITGSTDGIGKLAAIQLAQDGHKIYLHGRNPEKLATVISEVKSLSKNESVTGFVADFSDLDEVRTMAQEVGAIMSSLDVLINNAGVFNSSVSHNKEGLDMRYVVNYLAPYLLTNALMPLLQKGTLPRVINLSSAAQAPISIDVLKGIEHRSERETYAQSKLAITMWSFHLAQQVRDVVVIAVNPGSLLNTKMVKEAFGKFWSSADKGASILYDLAVLNKYKGSTGQYFDNDQGTFGPAHPAAYNEEGVDILLEATADLVG